MSVNLAPFELLADCPRCKVESALVEVYDPSSVASHLGVPAEARCRLCGAAFVGRVEPPIPGKPEVLATLRQGACPICAGRLTDTGGADERRCSACGLHAQRDSTGTGIDLRDEASVRKRLQAWAADDRLAGVDDLLQVTFNGLPLPALMARLGHEPTETSVDAFAYLFGAGRGVPTGGSVPRVKRESAPAPAPRTPQIDPRAVLYPLVSVMMADGEIKDSETEFLNRFLEHEGLAPLQPEEMRVHRPIEVAAHVAPERRAGLVEMMTQMAAIDGEPDASEARIVRAYAAAWSISEDDVDAWMERHRHRYVRGGRKFLLRLFRFFFDTGPPRRAVEPAP